MKDNELKAAATVLTDERIEMLWAKHADTARTGERRLAFGRAIEREVIAHAGNAEAPAAAGIEGLTRYEPSDDGMFTNNVSGEYVEYREVERLLAHAGVTAEPADALQIAEPSFAGWYVRKDSDGAIVVQKPGRGGCVLGGPHEDIENIEHTIFYAFLNDLMAAPAPAALAQTETDQLQDQLTGAMYALRHIAAGVENPEQCAASALEVIALLNAAAPAPQDDEPEDSVFYPPKALLKREDWDPSTRKPKATQAIEMEDALAAPVQAEQAQAEPLAWMNPETLDVIHDARKRAWENDFGMGGKAKAAEYTYRLVSPAQVPAAEVRAQALNEAAKLIDTKVYNYQDECGNYDHTTGVTEYPGNGAEWICEMEELAEEIRALAHQSTADKASEVRAAEWISVEDRLPEVWQLVLVYSPPTKFDYPDSVNIGFDCIDPNDDDHASWLNHNEHYEHFCCVAKPEGSVGPSAEAPYTHWMPLPAAPSTAGSANTGALGEKGAEA